MPYSSHTAVLFDFDHTLINKDSVGEFIFFSFRESRARFALLILMNLPLMVLSVSKRTLWWRNKLVYRCATAGLGSAGFDALLQRYFAHFHNGLGGKAYADGIEKLKHHQAQGHDIYVVSGAFGWMVEALCEQLLIDNVTVVGSTNDFYCYGANKVVKLDQLGIRQKHQYLVGYSDSKADIPMLRMCHESYVVNPKPRCQQAFQNAIPEAQVLNWH